MNMRASSQVFIAVFCGFSFPGFALQGASPAKITLPVERPAALTPRADRRITLDVVVTDRSGNPVPGLQQQDFTILDNKQPQTILSFRSAGGTDKAANPPVQAIVVIDAINTSFQGVALQRTQLEKFLRRDGGELPVPTSLVLLPATSEGQTVVSRDGNALADSLNSMPFGPGALYRLHGVVGAAERLQMSLGTLERLTSYEATQPGRKLMIWLGPGWPLLSGPGMNLSAKDRDSLFDAVVRLSTVLREARITLYNIHQQEVNDETGRAFYYESFLNGVGSANQVQNGNLALQVLAVQSGGRVFNLTNDIEGSIASCLADAKAFYTLSFDSPAADHPNKYHNLQLKIGVPRVTARTRSGYYAQP